MDNNFTEKVQAWLDTPEKERNYAEGAIFYLQLSNNKIVYQNLARNPERNAMFIEHEIRKYMAFRLAQITKQQVSEMQSKVDTIVVLRHLEATCKSPDSTEQHSTSSSSDSGACSVFKAGKRPDHDSLPVNIQALYVENANILHKMRELHRQLRAISLSSATCPDSERYPFLKEIIALDKQYHRNWQVYDSFSTSNSVTQSSSTDQETNSRSAEQALIEDSRQAQKNIYRQINLTKGRYKKNPSPALKEQIAALYRQLASPVESLTEQLLEMGIIESPNTTK